MKLPSGKISSKVLSSVSATTITTILLGLLTKLPSASSPWLSWLQDETMIAAIVTAIGGVFGYAAEETAFDTSGLSQPD